VGNPKADLLDGAALGRTEVVSVGVVGELGGAELRELVGGVVGCATTDMSLGFRRSPSQLLPRIPIRRRLGATSIPDHSSLNPLLSPLLISKTLVVV
jgi:hypothetical protein